MNELTTAARPAPATIEDVIARGDLSKLTTEQRVEYYNKVCSTLGLNPFTQPLQYITLQGKLVLYARKDACDQLRKLNGISTEVVSYEVTDGLLTVRVRATDKTGRTDEDFGVVSVAGLRGEAASNAFMKAVTKAKRRATLSISGLGFLDESDVESPTYGGQSAPLRLHPSMSQAERTDLASAGPGEVGPRDMSDGEAITGERVPDSLPSQAERAATAPCEIARGDDSDQTWSTWATLLMGYVRAAPDADTINEWTTANAKHISALADYDAAKHKRLVDMIAHQIAMRAEGGT